MDYCVARLHGLTLSHIVAIAMLLLLLLKLLTTTLGGTIERVLQCTVRELFVVSVQWVTEGPILDTVAHVVDVHPEGERFEAVTCYRR